MTGATRGITRRQASTLLTAGLAFAGLPAQLRAASSRFGRPQTFSWDGLVERARVLADSAYTAPETAPHLAPDFDAFGKLVYGPAETLDGSIRLFPAARGIAEHPVAIYLVERGRARKLVNTNGLFAGGEAADRSEEHTSELQSLMRI